VRCTQNATAGEEWRRNWHPERFDPPGSSDRLLVVGGGPAGLEAALVAARRGYEVTVAEAAEEFGGRLRFECALPGLSNWFRVRDYRLYALRQMANVNLFPASELDAEAVLEAGCEQVVLATGARWTRSLYSSAEIPVGELDRPGVFTPDDLAAGQTPVGPVVVYDFDNYYLGGAIAESLGTAGHEVHYATPAGHASTWTFMTNELPYVYKALEAARVRIHTTTLVTAFDGSEVTLKQVFTGAETTLAARSVVIVGLRLPRDDLYQALLARRDDWQAAGIRQVRRIGDAMAPGAIAHAVHAGHQFARELDGDAPLYLRDLPVSEHAPEIAYRELESE